jgi:hypothetical protein
MKGLGRRRLSLMLLLRASLRFDAVINITHRYPFDGTPYDVVGGTSWDAVMHDAVYIGRSDAIFSPDSDDPDADVAKGSIYGLSLPPGLINGMADLSIELWYRGFDSSPSAQIVCFDFLRIGRHENVDNIVVEYAHDGTTFNLTTSAPFHEEKKVYAAFVFSNDSAVAAYLNGNLVGVSTWKFKSIQESSGRANYLGSCGISGQGTEFNGVIEELRIWSTPLSAEKIKCHHVLGANNIKDEVCDGKDDEDFPTFVPTTGDKVFDRPNHNGRCSSGLPLPLWVLLLISFLIGAIVSAIIVILFCRCVYAKYKDGLQYDALGHDDFLGEDNGVAMKVII